MVSEYNKSLVALPCLMSRITPNPTRDILKPAYYTQLAISKSTDANQILVKWASVDGKIGHIRDFYSESTKCDLFAHVLDVWVLPLRGDSENTLGQVRGGNLAMGCTFILAGKLSSEMSEGDNKPYHRFSLKIQNSDCRYMSISMDSKEEEDG